MEDLVTLIEFVIGLFLAIIMYFVIKKGKVKLEMWPRIVGIGGGIIAFVFMMIMSMSLRPLSELVDYTITNFFWSLMLSIMSYLGCYMVVWRNRNGK